MPVRKSASKRSRRSAAPVAADDSNALSIAEPSLDSRGMRALVTWEVVDGSPNTHQILVDIGICLPGDRVRRLTPHAVAIVETNVNEINSIFLRLRTVANRFPGQVIVVLAAQMGEEAFFVHPQSLVGKPLVIATG